MRRAYDFGVKLREKYATFLPENYTKNEVYALSTDYDRTLMTASSILAGLYPPVQQWNNGVGKLWQPIPIHTNDIKFDYVITVCVF